MSQRTSMVGHLPTLRSPVRVAAIGIAAVFLLFGVLGFIPLFVSDFDEFAFAGHESQAFLLGAFQVSAVHNLVHLAFGIAGVVFARTASGARKFLIVGGLVYAVVWLYGLFVDFYSANNFLPVNVADNALHFLLAVAMLATGLLLARVSTARSDTETEPETEPG
ncbi:MAG: DUF4383 domain-containing protein [Haloechinothrix sp.]